MKSFEIHPREKGFVLWGHCQNILDDPVRIPSSVNNFRDMLPTIRLSPLGSPIIRKYTKPFNAFKRRGMYPNVSKCNAKRCVCCTHLCTKTTITSSVNGRKFSIINSNDLD